LIRQGSVENPQVRRYLNRLSLLLFVLGRYEEARGGRSAEPAKPAPG
jgi:cob(I)alamin adenosyltransferase